MGERKLTETAERFEDSVALSDSVARDSDGIGFIGFPYVRDAKAVAVSEGDAPPLLPNRLTVATEDYILSRRLYLYTTANPNSDWDRRFLDFALSASGQHLVSESGFVAQKIESEKLTVAGNVPEKYKKLTAGAERLSINFRFREGGEQLDNKALLDLDRVANFLAEQNLNGENLLLFGFPATGEMINQMQNFPKSGRKSSPKI